jgi:uncharacterized protein YndB with AHSA1/START domain
MRDSVTVTMAAPPDRIWAFVSDITNTSRYAEETFEAEWLDGASAPAVGVRFRGHVLRNGRPPAYWVPCTITECEPGRVFEFVVVLAGRPGNWWRYEFTPNGAGTDVTESFRVVDNWFTRGYWAVFGRLRGRTNRRNMQRTLERIKEIVETP